jgi:signal transduction histidine kinase/CheY-like chemotaxis protein
MRPLSIFARMLLAVLLPVLLISGLLTAVFLTARMGDMDKAYHQKSQALIRQLAVSSEYGLFSANVIQLQVLANAAMQESDVVSVTMLDDRGTTLLTAGQRLFTHLPLLGNAPSSTFDARRRVDLLAQPVFPSAVQLDDLLGTNLSGVAMKPVLLGHILVEFSQDALLTHERNILLLGLVVLVSGLVLAGLLALMLSQGVMGPIFRVSELIKRIGHGEFSARNPILPNDPLRDLQIVLNQTAERLGTSRDDLEQRIRMATEALREKKEEAETATLSKSRFLAAASHDLRQPTHALGMFVTRLAQLPHDLQTTGLIKNLESSVHAMQDLLDGLLDISRLDAHAVPVHLGSFPIEDIFEQLRGTFTLTAQEKKLTFHVRSSPVWVHSDAGLLHRVLINLVSNALSYTQSGGVVVACRRLPGGQKIRLEVWDSGQGIASEHHQAVFTEFFQVANAERNRTQGLGLGLNIVKRTLSLLAHPLALCSHLGRGTRFSFELPAVAPGHALHTRQETPAPAREFEGRQVLLIEDDLLVLAALEGLLASWGCELRCAVGASEALAHLGRGWVPELIISDYRLPKGANGIDTIAQLRAQVGDALPACLMSGDMNLDLNEASKAAELTLLHKPVRPAKLRSLVRHLLKNAETA